MDNKKEITYESKINKYETLPATDNALFVERELEKTQTSFSYELAIFENIKKGDVEAVKLGYSQYISSGFVMGNMSSNSLRQMKYWAVSGISIAAHYAILGGADETDAFNMSDICIRYIDSATKEADILAFLSEKIVDLTYLVYQSQLDATKNIAVRRCLHYIHIHLHQKISLEDLSKEVYMSKEYISFLFKKEMGLSVSKYIMTKKLDAALSDLKQGASISKVSYDYNFCSQTHFIQSFKKYYGCTPRQYLSADYSQNL